MNIKSFFAMIYKKYNDDEIPSLAAQTSFSLLLSFIPFLIYMLTVISNLNLPEENVYTYLQTFLPNNSYDAIKGIVDEILKKNDISFFSILLTIYFASKGTRSLIIALNKAYNEDENRNILVVFLMSFFFTIFFVFILTFALLSLVFGKQISEIIFNRIHLENYFIIIWDYLRHLLTMIFMIIIFTIIYKHAPNCKLKIKEVIPGSIFTTILWTTISFFFSYYINNFNTSYVSLYGSLSGIFILLIWLYISSIIIILGGEVNAYLKNGRGTCI